ncbi:hypothetical protein BN1723_003032, partial [Verticillium longisporum]
RFRPKYDCVHFEYCPDPLRFDIDHDCHYSFSCGLIMSLPWQSRKSLMSPDCWILLSRLQRTRKEVIVSLLELVISWGELTGHECFWEDWGPTVAEAWLSLSWDFASRSRACLDTLEITKKLLSATCLESVPDRHTFWTWDPSNPESEARQYVLWEYERDGKRIRVPYGGCRKAGMEADDMLDWVKTAYPALGWRLVVKIQVVPRAKDPPNSGFTVAGQGVIDTPRRTTHRRVVDLLRASSFEGVGFGGALQHRERQCSSIRPSRQRCG